MIRCEENQPEFNAYNRRCNMLIIRILRNVYAKSYIRATIPERYFEALFFILNPES